MKLLLAGGGTGGHVNPAIAIAQAMEKRYKDFECAFVGRRGGEENQAITSRGYKLYTLDVKGLDRKLGLDMLKSVYLAVRSLKEAREILLDFAPDVTLGTGGYVCWPIIKESIKAGIPTLMHESNIYPGLVTRTLGKKCTALFLNSEQTKKFLKDGKNCIVTGNPLRGEFCQKTRKSARAALGIKESDFFVVSFGGSLGSKKINDTVIEMMADKSSRIQGLRHVHATGTRYFEEIKNEHGSLADESDLSFSIKPYIDDMPSVLTAADLVICRSGAITLSEISKAGVAAILIPSPNVADDHQRKNAEALADANAAVMITEEELNARTLRKKVFELMSDGRKRRKLQENIRKFHVPNSEEIICSQIRRSIR
ncbi:MAG: undecaprenyldiphospho-muramoylpentapeptide beta-N-acetylglucosaminyltransferase [Clostridia bacterium]|nr:undecaprenyldiphospho-muramoylpentapeptide beta-N-acetylglucosaminyltransferase [Clostridia bacterium]